MVVLRWPVAREMRDERLILRVGEDVPVVAKQESKKASKLVHQKFGIQLNQTSLWRSNFHRGVLTKLKSRAFPRRQKEQR